MVEIVRYAEHESRLSFLITIISNPLSSLLRIDVKHSLKFPSLRIAYKLVEIAEYAEHESRLSFLITISPLLRIDVKHYDHSWIRLPCGGCIYKGTQTATHPRVPAKAV